MRESEERGACVRPPERGVRGAQPPGKRKKRVYISIYIYNINNRKSTNVQKVHPPELVYPDSDFSILIQ